MIILLLLLLLLFSSSSSLVVVFSVDYCLVPEPLITMTDLSCVEAVTTGIVPCIFSVSFIGQSQTTTFIEEAVPL